MNSQTNAVPANELLASIAQKEPHVSEPVMDMLSKVDTYFQSTSAIPSVMAVLGAYIRQPSVNLSQEEHRHHVSVIISLVSFLDELKTTDDWFKCNLDQDTLAMIRGTEADDDGDDDE